MSFILEGNLFGGAAPAFTPADLGAGLKAWYDASDTGTITATGADVNTVTDKSGNGLTLTGLTTTRPSTGVHTQNGLNVLTFAADYLTAALASDWTFMHDGTDWRLSAVAYFGTSSNPNAAYGLVGTGAGTTANVGADFWWDDRASQIRNENIFSQISKGSAANAVSENLGTSLIYPPQQWHLWSARTRPAEGTAANRSHMHIDSGSLVNNNVETNAHVTSAPAHPLQLGAIGNGVLPAEMRFAELVVYTSDSRADVEAYLKAKWATP